MIGGTGLGRNHRAVSGWELVEDEEGEGRDGTTHVVVRRGLVGVQVTDIKMATVRNKYLKLEPTKTSRQSVAISIAIHVQCIYQRTISYIVLHRICDLAEKRHLSYTQSIMKEIGCI